MADGYKGYNNVCLKPDVYRLGCWAHARRYFFKALKSLKKGKKQTLAGEAMQLIGELYKIDKHVRTLTLKEKQTYRREHATPVINSMRAWLDDHINDVTPSSLTGRAMHYLNKQWPNLIRFLDDANLPLDNNLSLIHI